MSGLSAFDGLNPPPLLAALGSPFHQPEEERLRLLESAVVQTHDTVLITAADTIDPPGPRILYTNPAFTTMTGYSAAEVLGRHPRFLQGPKTDPAVRRQIREALLRSQPVFVELLNYRKDGTEFWAEMALAPVADADGVVTHFVSVQRDVTERRRMADLARAKQAAEAESRVRGELLSRISHELRTPLNAILGFGQLLEASPLEEQQRDGVQQILEAGGRLLRLVDEVLDLVHVGGENTLAAAEIPVDLGEVMAECVRQVQPLAESCGVRCAAPGAEQAGLRLHIDPHLLRQVLLNLLSNAIKYNRPGGCVTVECAEQVGGRVRLSVRDTGLGMSPQQIADLFVPFTPLRGLERSCLGLVIAKKLVESIGGEISVGSTPGEGSVFQVDFPRAESSAPS